MNAVPAMLARRAMVWRDGVRQQIMAEQLLAGDWVLLESGDKVPADMRLVRCENLRITEAALTGNPVVIDGGLLMVVVQWLFTNAPFMQATFQTQSLGATSWVLIDAAL